MDEKDPITRNDPRIRLRSVMCPDFFGGYFRFLLGALKGFSICAEHAMVTPVSVMT